MKEDEGGRERLCACIYWLTVAVALLALAKVVAIAATVWTALQR